MVSEMHLIVLKELRGRVTPIAGMPEPIRQKVIDMGMEEPPLVDVVFDCVIVNIFGEKELRRRWRELRHGPAPDATLPGTCTDCDCKPCACSQSNL